MAHRAAVFAACVAMFAALVQPASGRSPQDKGWRSEGCLAVGTHSLAVGGVRPWDCYFLATGPVYYAAATTNPYSISVWDPKTKRYADVVRRASAGPPTAGRIELKPGDRVAVSISCWDYTKSTWCMDAVGGRYGTIAVHSQL